MCNSLQDLRDVKTVRHVHINLSICSHAAGDCPFAVSLTSAVIQPATKLQARQIEQLTAEIALSAAQLGQARGSDHSQPASFPDRKLSSAEDASERGSRAFKHYNHQHAVHYLIGHKQNGEAQGAGSPQPYHASMTDQPQGKNASDLFDPFNRLNENESTVSGHTHETTASGQSREVAANDAFEDESLSAFVPLTHLYTLAQHPDMLCASGLYDNNI